MHPPWIVRVLGTCGLRGLSLHAHYHMQVAVCSQTQMQVERRMQRRGRLRPAPRPQLRMLRFACVTSVKCGSGQSRGSIALCCVVHLLPASTPHLQCQIECQVQDAGRYYTVVKVGAGLLARPHGHIHNALTK